MLTMRRLAARVLRPLKILVLWLTGQRELQARLSELEVHFLRFVGAERERASQLEAQLARFEEAQRDQLEQLSSTVTATIVEEIDRLDGYMLHHTADLQREIRTGQNKRAGTQLQYTAPQMDALLIVGEFDIVVPTCERGLLAYIMRHGTSAIEPAVRAALLRSLRPGMVAVDAGANIGLHSLVMAQAVGPEGRLIAFEALPHLADALSSSLMLNGFASRSEVVQAALAEGEGEAVINAAVHSPVSSLFALEGIATTPITVRRTSLDAHIPPGGRVDLVKMDIEGAEPLAWAGMTRVLKENPELVVVIEWSSSHFARSGHMASDLMASIQSAGYSPWLLRDEAPDTPTPFNPTEASRLEEGNLLLLRLK